MENKEKHISLINKTLIWDYDFKGKYDTEESRKWYVERVLSYGTKKDITTLGIETIRKYLKGIARFF